MIHRHWIAAGLVLATALLVACGGSADGAQDAAGSTGTTADGADEREPAASLPEVRVVVRDRFGAPIAGAAVAATIVGGEEDGSAVEAVTDESGVATLATAARTLTVRASASGYTVATDENVFATREEPAAELRLLPVPEGDGVWLVGEGGLVPMPVSELTADAQWPMNYTIQPQAFDVTLLPARHVFLTKGYNFTSMHDVSFLPDVTFGQGGVTLTGVNEEFAVTGGGTVTTYAFDVRPGRWVLADFERSPEFPDATIAAENVAVLILAEEGAVTPTGAGQGGRATAASGAASGQAAAGASAVGPLAGRYSGEAVTLELRDGDPAILVAGGERIELVAVYATDAAGNEVLTLTNARGEQELVSVARRGGRIVLVDDWGNVMEGGVQ